MHVMYFTPLPALTPKRPLSLGLPFSRFVIISQLQLTQMLHVHNNLLTPLPNSLSLSLLALRHRNQTGSPDHLFPVPLPERRAAVLHHIARHPPVDSAAGRAEEGRS